MSVLSGPVEKVGKSSNCFRLDHIRAQNGALTVRTNSALPPILPLQNAGLLEALEGSGPLFEVGWIGVRENTDVTDLVVTVDNVDSDLMGNLERVVVFKDCVDEILLGAKADFRRDEGDIFHE